MFASFGAVPDASLRLVASTTVSLTYGDARTMLAALSGVYRSGSIVTR